MLWTIAVVLVILWLLGLVGSYTIVGLIHILLVIAVIVVLDYSERINKLCHLQEVINQTEFTTSRVREIESQQSNRNKEGGIYNEKQYQGQGGRNISRSEG